MENVDDLPNQKDDFWKDADNRTYKVEARLCTHNFKRVSATQAECTCGVGFNIQGPYEVKEGHIYLHGSLVV